MTQNTKTQAKKHQLGKKLFISLSSLSLIAGGLGLSLSSTYAAATPKVETDKFPDIASLGKVLDFKSFLGQPVKIPIDSDNPAGVPGGDTDYLYIYPPRFLLNSKTKKLTSFPIKSIYLGSGKTISAVKEKMVKEDVEKTLNDAFANKEDLIKQLRDQLLKKRSVAPKQSGYLNGIFQIFNLAHAEDNLNLNLNDNLDINAALQSILSSNDNSGGTLEDTINNMSDEELTAFFNSDDPRAQQLVMLLLLNAALSNKIAEADNTDKQSCLDQGGDWVNEQCSLDTTGTDNSAKETACTDSNGEWNTVTTSRILCLRHCGMTDKKCDGSNLADFEESEGIIVKSDTDLMGCKCPTNQCLDAEGKCIDSKNQDGDDDQDNVPNGQDKCANSSPDGSGTVNMTAGSPTMGCTCTQIQALGQFQQTITCPPGQCNGPYYTSYTSQPGTCANGVATSAQCVADNSGASNPTMAQQCYNQDQQNKQNQQDQNKQLQDLLKKLMGGDKKGGGQGKGGDKGGDKSGSPSSPSSPSSPNGDDKTGKKTDTDPAKLRSDLYDKVAKGEMTPEEAEAAYHKTMTQGDATHNPFDPNSDSKLWDGRPEEAAAMNSYDVNKLRNQYYDAVKNGTMSKDEAEAAFQKAAQQRDSGSNAQLFDPNDPNTKARQDAALKGQPGAEAGQQLPKDLQQAIDDYRNNPTDENYQKYQDALKKNYGANTLPGDQKSDTGEYQWNGKPVSKDEYDRLTGQKQDPEEYPDLVPDPDNPTTNPPDKKYNWGKDATTSSPDQTPAPPDRQNPLKWGQDQTPTPDQQALDQALKDAQSYDQPQNPGQEQTLQNQQQLDKLRNDYYDALQQQQTADQALQESRDSLSATEQNMTDLQGQQSQLQGKVGQAQDALNQSRADYQQALAEEGQAQWQYKQNPTLGNRDAAADALGKVDSAEKAVSSNNDALSKKQTELDKINQQLADTEAQKAANEMDLNEKMGAAAETSDQAAQAQKQLEEAAQESQQLPEGQLPEGFDVFPNSTNTPAGVGPLASGSSDRWVKEISGEQLGGDTQATDFWANNQDSPYLSGDRGVGVNSLAPSTPASLSGLGNVGKTGGLPGIGDIGNLGGGGSSIFDTLGEILGNSMVNWDDYLKPEGDQSDQAKQDSHDAVQNDIGSGADPQGSQ